MWAVARQLISSLGLWCPRTGYLPQETIAVSAINTECRLKNPPSRQQHERRGAHCICCMGLETHKVLLTDFKSCSVLKVFWFNTVHLFFTCKHDCTEGAAYWLGYTGKAFSCCECGVGNSFTMSAAPDQKRHSCHCERHLMFTRRQKEVKMGAMMLRKRTAPWSKSEPKHCLFCYIWGTGTVLPDCSLALTGYSLILHIKVSVCIPPSICKLLCKV